MTEDVNILAVDDTEQNLVALRMLLKRPGIRLIEARSGNEALEALLASDIALALVDVNMPEMDGFELAELMRGSERTRDVPVIFLTAAVPEGDRIFRGYEAGAVDFLFKPIHPNLLVSKVEVFAKLHRQKLELARQLEQIQHAQAMSDIFIGVLGHDLRSPLSSIVNAATLLEMQSGSSEHTLKAVAVIQRASKRMNRLTRQVLDFALARVRGRIPIAVGDCDLAEISRGLVAELEPGASQRVHIEIEGDLAGRWDPDRMTQVIANLLNNALEHGDEHAPILLRLDGGVAATVMLEVRNRGTIPSELMTVLFAPFKPRSGGIGLGLYIVDQIVRSHRGELGVSSTEADGTRVKIVLPRAVAGDD